MDAGKLTSISSFEEGKNGEFLVKFTGNGNDALKVSAQEKDALERRYNKACLCNTQRLTGGWSFQRLPREDCPDAGENKYVVFFRHDDSKVYLLDDVEHDDFLIRHDITAGSIDSSDL